ncbi:MAG: PqqD family protein [Clostridia bacterium]|nr:PqqD family protein [Clostridia bacterium]
MAKKLIIDENYLDRKPVRNKNVSWKQDDENKVTLEIENTGFFSTIAQKVFKKPKVSYIHLDENGSFLWPLLDGEKTISELGVLVKEHFGEKAEPLYERLAKYFQILESYKFIEFKDQGPEIRE